MGLQGSTDPPLPIDIILSPDVSFPEKYTAVQRFINDPTGEQLLQDCQKLWDLIKEYNEKLSNFFN
jgi:hypothetical protein